MVQNTLWSVTGGAKKKSTGELSRKHGINLITLVLDFQFKVL
jgi:hypothetical protein